MQRVEVSIRECREGRWPRVIREETRGCEEKGKVVVVKTVLPGELTGCDYAIVPDSSA